MAYQDFFDNEVTAKQGDWAWVLGEYLYSGPAPLINGYTGGRESSHNLKETQREERLTQTSRPSIHPSSVRVRIPQQRSGNPSPESGLHGI